MKVSNILNMPKNYYRPINFAPTFKGGGDVTNQFREKLDEVDSLMGNKSINFSEAELKYSDILEGIDNATNLRTFPVESLKARTLHEMAYAQYKQEKFQVASRNQQKAIEVLKTTTPENREQTREKKKALMELYVDMGFVYNNLSIDDLSGLAIFKAYTITQDLLKNDRELSNDQILYLRQKSNLCLQNLATVLDNSDDAQVFCRLNWDDFLDQKHMQADIRMVNPEAQRRADVFYEKMLNRSQKI